MCKKHILLACLITLSFFGSAGYAQLPEVPDEAITALGMTIGTPKRNGFVFIEGRYISPPYTVSRKGNGIFINRIQVEQPIVWSAETLNPSVHPQPKKDEAPKTPEPVEPSPEPQPPAESAAVVVTDSIVVSNAPPAEAPVGKTLDALFDDSATNSVAGVEKNGSGTEKKATPVVLTQKQKDELRQKLDAIRVRFEQGLARGEIYFFSPKYGRVNGTYGTAKTLFSVLPEALRYAQSPQDLMSRLRQGGVSFLDASTCVDLYKNKLSFMVLNDRRKMIELNESSKR